MAGLSRRTIDRNGGLPSFRSLFEGGGREPVTGPVVPMVHGAALVAVLMVGAGHAWALDQLAMSLFYLAPVLLVAWYLGRGATIVWSVLAAVTWVAAELAGMMGMAGATGTAGSEAGGVTGAGPVATAVVVWNGVVQLGIFLVSGLAVSTLRSFVDYTRDMAGTDHLTGVLDSGSFQELVELERSRALRYDRPFTLAYLDVDRLGRVNDLRGHTTGDRTLQLLATTIRENIRSMDSVSRLGGDEFGLLFPETGRGAAEIALGKIRSCLDEAVRKRDLPITFSVGAVICVGAPESVDRLIQRADALMYKVKDRGGDGLAVEVLDDEFGIEAILQRS